ncbi:MAG: hypothetical protein ABJC79_17140 [Acidimicrobiia bacterium]
MCDTLCVHVEAGLVFAKNSDRPPDEPQVVRAFPARGGGSTVATQYLELPDVGAYALVGSQPTWLWGLEHGVNEHGVAIGNEKVWTMSLPHSRPPAMLGMDLVRLGLERARTADDALVVITELLERHGQGGSGERDHDEPYDSSFLIADRTTAWILESADRTWAAREAGPGTALSNRLSLAADWSRGSPDLAPGTDLQTLRNPRIPTSIADHRLAVTRAWVDRGVGDPAAVLPTLRDHGAGPHDPATRSGPIPPGPGADNRGISVCMHVRSLQATTASMVVAVPSDPDAGIRAWAALGSPCVSVYVPCFPLVGVSPALGDAHTWSRFAALRDRAEASDHDLAQIQAALAPVETTLWTTAAEIEPADRAAQRAFVAGAFAPVDAVLTALAV